MSSIKKEFEEWVAKENIKVYDKLSDVTNKYNFELEKGQKCSFFNDCGEIFHDHTIMGFHERQNKLLSNEDCGRYVYLDCDSYMNTIDPEYIVLDHRSEYKKEQIIKTESGLEFNTITKTIPGWKMSNLTIAETHLSMWGVIAIDKDGLPINNKLEYEAISLAIEKSNKITLANKITDIHIFSLKEGGMGISCKVNGSVQPYKKLDKEDINTLNNNTGRRKLAQKYYSPEVVKSSFPINSTKELHSSGSKTLLADVSSDTGTKTGSYLIHDKSTNKTGVLSVGDIDLSKQPAESLQGLLSGKQVEMTNTSGFKQMMGLNKTPAGWGLQVGKQVFSAADTGAEL